MAVMELEGVTKVTRPGFSTKIRTSQRLLKRVSDIQDSEADILNSLLPKPPKNKSRRKKAKEDIIGVSFIEKIENTKKLYERCLQLSKEFDVIELDRSVMREIPCVPNTTKHWQWQQHVRYAKQSHKPAPPRPTMKIPLVWTVELPSRNKDVSKRFCGVDFKTAVPNPTQEAIKLFTEHKEKFDHMELWWVPKSFTVSVPPPPKPDPVLVGVVKIPGDKSYRFELTRWIDESVENGWFANNAY